MAAKHGNYIAVDPSPRILPALCLSVSLSTKPVAPHHAM